MTDLICLQRLSWLADWLAAFDGHLMGWLAAGRQGGRAGLARGVWGADLRGGHDARRRVLGLLDGLLSPLLRRRPSLILRLRHLV